MLLSRPVRTRSTHFSLRKLTQRPPLCSRTSEVAAAVLMSLFFEFKTTLDQTRAAAEEFVEQSAWSAGDSPILAVAYGSGEVKFFNEEGTETLKAFSRTGSGAASRPTCLTWHPVFPLLTIGYDDGILVVWTPQDGLLRENKTHKNRLNVVSWSPRGTRLVTADAKGLVCVWSPKPDGSLMLLNKYNKGVNVTLCKFSKFNLSAQAPARGKGSRCPPFFLGGDKGEVMFADDLGHCSVIQKMNAGSSRFSLF